VERLGELDKIMIDAIVASANGQHGAMALITAERTAHEFALMNLKRAQAGEGIQRTPCFPTASPTGAAPLHVSAPTPACIPHPRRQFLLA
jgi:hypothetical protein